MTATAPLGCPSRGPRDVVAPLPDSRPPTSPGPNAATYTLAGSGTPLAPTAQQSDAHTPAAATPQQPNTQGADASGPPTGDVPETRASQAQPAPLESLVALVTGAARGIGAAIALRLAREGCAVAVMDLSEEDCAGTVEAITGQGGTALAVAADVADEDAVLRALTQLTARLGPPTVVVSNAGIGPRAPLTELTAHQWDTVLDVNLRGAFLVTRATAPHMIDAGWGRIITISSISAAGDAARADYGAAKAGLIGFTKSLALQLGRWGITANAIAPGFVVSDMTRASAKALGVDFATFQDTAAQTIPVGRVGRPEDIAHTAAYLASPDAGFVSGQVIYVAGGPVN